MKIVTFGEVLLRLSPADNLRLTQANSFDVNYGGSEANVGVLLSALGNDVAFVTRLPENDIGEAALRKLRAYGLHTGSIARGGSRMGIYFMEPGASVRAGKVIYDRAHSAFAEITPEDLDYDEIFRDAAWLHWSGITPALSPSAAQTQRQMLEEAKKRNVKVSCDLNYRSLLWSPEEATRVMVSLMEYTDVLIGNESHALSCLGFTPEAGPEGETELARAARVCRELCRKFSLDVCAATFRRSHGASRNTVSAVMCAKGQSYTTKTYDLYPLIDRVGSGDAFTGGLIHKLINGETPQKALGFALAACALKHTVPGDISEATEAEIAALADGDGNAVFQR